MLCINPNFCLVPTWSHWKLEGQTNKLSVHTNYLWLVMQKPYHLSCAHLMALVCWIESRKTVFAYLMLDVLFTHTYCLWLVGRWTRKWSVRGQSPGPTHAPWSTAATGTTDFMIIDLFLVMRSNHSLIPSFFLNFIYLNIFYLCCVEGSKSLITILCFNLLTLNFAWW